VLPRNPGVVDDDVVLVLEVEVVELLVVVLLEEYV
jgi:hypothetical protein